MAFYRFMALIRKDLSWCRGDAKILSSLLFGPVFFGSIFLIPYVVEEDLLKDAYKFQNPKAAFLFVSITLTSLITGIYLTCELIFQEKAKGTILALLATPLRPFEFILGKIFLTFSFSFLFFLIYIALSVFFDKQMSFLLNPLTILNLALFAGTMCLWGSIPGLFFSSGANRQQAIIIPSVLLTASLALILEWHELVKISPAIQDLYFFNPLAHIFESMESAEWRELLIHTGFNILFFAGFALFCAEYTKFYFSNNREKRFSLKLLAGFCGLTCLYIVSGLLAPALL